MTFTMDWFRAFSILFNFAGSLLGMIILGTYIFRALRMGETWRFLHVQLLSTGMLILSCSGIRGNARRWGDPIYPESFFAVIGWIIVDLGMVVIYMLSSKKFASDYVKSENKKHPTIS